MVAVYFGIIKLLDKRLLALGRLKVGEKNRTEEAYGQRLRILWMAGDVLWYKFEGLKFRLADNTFYTPDYVVMAKSCQIELHEVKGVWTDDARAKIKIAADMYPFKFIAVQKIKSEWKFEEFD